jgi:protocatechuate 3,4-dioxygenase beta subunit
MKDSIMETENDNRESESKQGVSRRNFLKMGSLGAIGSLLLPGILKGRSPMMPPPGCDITTPDILGPYYLSNAPFTTQVADVSDPGTRLFLTGFVYGPDCTTPIPDALIDVWQADDAGNYDMTNGYNLRARMNADGSGSYSFETIFPGLYLNGATYRPRHIHLKASANGFQNLTTQLYFEGDPYIATDPWASQPEAAMRILPLTTDANGAYHGTFDIVLDSTTSIARYKPYSELGFLLPNSPNPFAEKTIFRFGVFKRMQVQLSLYNESGAEVKTLVNQQMSPGRYTAEWDASAVPNGIYLCALVLDGKREFTVRAMVQR